MIKRRHGGRILRHRLLQRAYRRDQLLFKYQLFLLKLKLFDAHHDFIIVVIWLRALCHPDILKVVVLRVIIIHIRARCCRRLLLQLLLLLFLLSYLLLDVHPLVEELRVDVATIVALRRLLASLRLFALFLPVCRAEGVRCVVD